MGRGTPTICYIINAPSISALSLLIIGIAFNKLLCFLPCVLTVVQTTSVLLTPGSISHTQHKQDTFYKHLAEEAGTYPVLKEMKPREMGA